MYSMTLKIPNHATIPECLVAQLYVSETQIENYNQSLSEAHMTVRARTQGIPRKAILRVAHAACAHTRVHSIGPRIQVCKIGDN